MSALRALRYLVIVGIVAAAGGVLFRSSDVYQTTSPGAPEVGALQNVEASLQPPPSAAPELTRDETINISVYEKVSPGVVNITSRVVEYDFFFRPFAQEGAGSGSVIDYDGNIVTNNHVIEGAEELEVTLPDQSKWRATLVGNDPSSDLAVIRIRAPRAKLHPVRFGDSSALRVGHKVLAIGNPFRLHNTLTTGIVSSLGRTVDAPNGARFENIIQTDAGLNPGNSGGPLLNTAGDLIGVNTLIFSPSGGNIGLGFAIPVSKVKRITDDLLRYGQVRRASLGTIRGIDMNSELAEVLRLGTRTGILVSQVPANSPAAAAGLRGGSRRVRFYNNLLLLGGDIITALNDKPVSSGDDLYRVLEGLQPGDTVPLDVVRDGSKLRLRVTLGSSLDETRRRI